MEDFPYEEVQSIIWEYDGDILLCQLSNELVNRGYYTRGIKKSLEEYDNAFWLEDNGSGSYTVSCLLHGDDDDGDDGIEISDCVTDSDTEETIKGFIRSNGGECSLGYLSSLLVDEGYDTSGLKKKYFDLKKNMFQLNDANGLGNYIVTIKTRRDQMIDSVNRYFENIDRNSTCGSSNLETIRDICKKLGFRKPKSVTEGKMILEGVFINIFDYVKEGKKCKRFTSLKNLRKYSVKKNKLFPREKAKTEGMRFLLKEFF